MNETEPTNESTSGASAGSEGFRLFLHESLRKCASEIIELLDVEADDPRVFRVSRIIARWHEQHLHRMFEQVKYVTKAELGPVLFLNSGHDERFFLEEPGSGGRTESDETSHIETLDA